MRVSHRNLYAGFIDSLNRSTAQLHELNLQGSTQKKVNRPSDDPQGTARILQYRDSLNQLGRYRENVDTAKGWLNLADSTLLEVNNLIIRARELAEQGATGTYSADNREQMSYEARQLFEQMVSLANTSFEGQSIFAGHKTDGNAFEAGLHVTTNDPSDATGGFDAADIAEIKGNTNRSYLVQFLSSGGIDEAEYRFSKDGGKTWVEDNPPRTVTGDMLDLDEIQIEFKAEATSTVNETTDYNDTNGTWLWVRPTANYLGDAEDNKDISVEGYGSNVTATATGNFPGNVMVRIDSGDDTPDSGNRVQYSYSLDGGKVWTSGNPNDNTTNPLSLSVPGGILKLSDDFDNGDQFVIRPETAAIRVDISKNESVQINNIGKDIFGGMFKGEAVFGEGEGKNLFETMGRLIGYLETNDQQGVQKSLEDLQAAEKHVLNKTADVGARENRLETVDSLLSGLELNETSRLSKIEDIDIAELMTELSQQQIVYQAVLKSSSTIMKMSLVNFV
ncbi:MAG: flagellar hook-associated protein FlgL [Desulfovibrionales bacterium]